MTSALHHSPSQAKREARRFNVLKEQRRQLLRSLEECKWRLENLLVLLPSNRPERVDVETDLRFAREVIGRVRECRIVPVDE